jgi:hypothetical protein
MMPSGLRGVVNDTVAIYFLYPATATGLVARCRFACGRRFLVTSLVQPQQLLNPDVINDPADIGDAFERCGGVEKRAGGLAHKHASGACLEFTR